MLTMFQKFARSKVALILIGLLVVSFAIWGVNDVFKPNLTSWVVKAGDREIGGVQFKLMFDQNRERMEQQFQQPIPVEFAVQQGMDRQLLEEMMAAESLNAIMDRMGLRAPKALIAEQLKAIPAFFDQITGRFDENRYRAALGERNLTPELFEKGLADDIMRGQFGSGLMNGLQSPRIYAAATAAYALEERDVSYFLITPAMVGAVPPPTDAEMEAFLKENAQRIMRPEFRTISVVRFSAADYAEGVTVSEADIQKRFDFRKDSLSQPEVRTVIQIAVKDDKAGADVIARLKAGEDAVAVAKRVNVEPVIYENKPRSAIFDKTIADAAFGLAEGGVSGVLQGQFGRAVVKVVAVTEGKTATLDEVRGDLTEELKTSGAATKAYAAAQTYDEAHRKGASMADAAAKAGAKVIVLGPVSAQGAGPDGKPVEGVTPEILQTAFGLKANAESTLIEVSQTEQFMVRVDKITPPAPPPLAEVRGDLSKLLVARKQNELMQAKANELMARVRKGETMEAVAASVGATVVTERALTRMSAGEKQETLGQELIGGAFAGGPGAPFLARVPDKGIAVAKIDVVRGGKTETVAGFIQQASMQTTQQVMGDMVEAAGSYAKARVNARYDLDAARRALGLDPKQFAAAEEEKAAAAPKDGKSQ